MSESTHERQIAGVLGIESARSAPFSSNYECKCRWSFSRDKKLYNTLKSKCIDTKTFNAIEAEINKLSLSPEFPLDAIPQKCRRVKVNTDIESLYHRRLKDKGNFNLEEALARIQQEEWEES